MWDTPASVLKKIQQENNPEAWEKFVRLYTPLLRRWAQLRGLRPPNDEDLVQELMLHLVKVLPKFSYDPNRSFRSWLRKVATNEWNKRCQERLPVVPGELSEPVDPEPDPMTAFWEHEYYSLLRETALDLITRKTNVSEQTLTLFREHVLGGRPIAEVAEELGMERSSAYVAKNRILGHLRSLLEGFLD